MPRARGRPRQEEKPERREPESVPKRRPRGSGSVGTRADGRIFCVLPSRLDLGRRPIYTSPLTGDTWTSEAEAAAWLDAELVARRHPPPPPVPGDELLGVYCWRWWQAGAAFWPARTARAYRRWLALILSVGELVAVPVGTLTHEAVRTALGKIMRATWHRTRRDGTPTTEPRPYSRRSVQGARMVLGLALADLVPDVLPHNPVRRARLPKAQAPEQPVWDGDQAERFLASAEALVLHLALAFRLILRRGLRRGEVLALRWSDLDERRRVLVVDETAGQRAGETGDTKGRRRREVPLSADLLARLREHRLRFSADTICEWVFTNPETGLPYNREILGAWTPKIARHAGVPVITPKDMRATFATNALDQGWPLPRVAAILGHADVSVTAQAYARAIGRREERIAAEADQLDALLDAAARQARDTSPQPIRRVPGAENSP